LDACLTQDPNSKVACESAVKNSICMVFGEVSTKAEINFETLDEVEETDDNGKPSKLKPLDFGLTYFTKKDRLINSPGAWLEMMTAERYKDSATLPIAFGATTSKDDDLADMELQGWEIL
jgi:hypothetical protein